MTDTQIQDLERYEESAAYAEVEKMVLRFAEQWTRDGRAQPDLVSALGRSLSPGQLVTLAATVALANWTGRFNETFGIKLP